jgi:hypothetical protein
MKWIIISHDRPANLLAVLESARECLPHTTPHILVSASTDELYDGYDVVDKRFAAKWYEEAFRFNMVDGINMPNAKGTDATVLITTDTMLFQKRFNPMFAWNTLQDKTILGMSLLISPTPSATARYFSGSPEGLQTWMIEDQPFSYGAVYRTSDLLGPLARNQWDSPCTLKDALNRDPAMRRRARMACLAEAPMMEAEPCLDSVNMLLNGWHIDIDQLREKRVYKWKPYGEE